MIHSARFELKYLIRESQAVAIADFVASYLRPSQHNGAGSARGHPVVSLYLDSPDFFFFHQADNGLKNRIKLRIRFYDNEWQRPAFLEIKRRDSEVICKERALISREEVRRILSQGWPMQPYFAECDRLTHDNDRHCVSKDFWEIANRIQARGMIYVSYFREIYKSAEDEELHVTFDRQIRGSRYDGTGKLEVPSRGWPPLLPPYLDPFPKDGVILEMKFNNRAPRWMLEVVKIFNLHRIPVCKYCACVNAQQLQWGASVLPAREENFVL
ncbi:MAG TPA: polyphosphate polymerase domain-containing protein [Verrucomicrobiae bacterium]|nr:polyphosphate polymerase domain-containing protein [Verrucomicrobiae bacterium]